MLPLFWRRALQRVFRFDPWHVSPYAARAYAHWVVAELNAGVQRGRVVEIGCGLADILRRLNFAEKLGLDSDCAVLKGATFLCLLSPANWGKTRFRTASFPTVGLQGRYDAIILVNWIHNIAPDILKAAIDNLFAEHLPTGGRMVLDVLENATYRYNHDIGDLCAELDCEIQLSPVFEFGRRIAMVKKLGG